MKRLIASSIQSNVDKFLDYYDREGSYVRNPAGFAHVHRILDKYDGSNGNDTVDIAFGKATPSEQAYMIQMIYPENRSDDYTLDEVPFYQTMEGVEDFGEYLYLGNKDRIHLDYNEDALVKGQGVFMRDSGQKYRIFFGPSASHPYAFARTVTRIERI